MSSSETPPGGIQISTDAFVVIIERLARIETQLEGIRRDRDEMQKEMIRFKDDHEGRIRGLERWKYMLPPTLVTSLIAAVVAIYGQVGR